MIRFTIPYPETKAGKTAFCKRFGLNAYYAGKHYQARRRDAHELHGMTETAIKRARIYGQQMDGPAEIRFYWDDRLDIDNHAVIGKAVVDAMKGYILKDDNRKWVKKVSHEFWDGGGIMVEVVPYGH